MLRLALFLLLAAPPVPKADLLLENGVVAVSAEAPARRASIVVRGGKILFVGPADEARRLAGGAPVLDLKGGFVFPGLTDAHLHLENLGKAGEEAKLAGSSDAAEAATRMAAGARSLPPGAWAQGRGWDQNLWPGRQFPDARDLDRAVPDRPAVARRVDGHAVWVNQKALDAAGIRAATPDPAGGRILRREDGSPSGVLVDNAIDLVKKVQPPPSAEDRERWILAGAKACAKAGLTEVHDASGYDTAGIAALERLAARGALPIRVYATVSPERSELDRFRARGVRVGKGSDFLTVRAIKGYADGALGSRGAALLADYADEPGTRGLLVTPPERLAEIARDARREGWQLWVHAIGDRGNRVALDAFEAAIAAVPAAPEGGRRPRIEHAQVLSDEDFARFPRLGVIASVQPTHATSDMPWAEARVGPRRIGGAYAWRRLVRAGARLAGGSDAPVESERPLLGIFAAVTRQDPHGRPPGGWRPQERLTPAEALALFTEGAAFAAFEETSRGRIAPGFDADLTVLGADVRAVAPEGIPAVPVVMTVVGGRVAGSPAGRR